MVWTRGNTWHSTVTLNNNNVPKGQVMLIYIDNETAETLIKLLQDITDRIKEQTKEDK